MIIHTHQRSKRRKPTAKERQLAAEWQELLERTQLKTKPSKVSKHSQTYVPEKTLVRETPRYPSVPLTGPMACTKPVEEKRYTGDKMLGIGTLHKSNAVPIFSEEEAKDQANMRR
jgi:hypothetical protein